MSEAFNGQVSRPYNKTDTHLLMCSIKFHSKMISAVFYVWSLIALTLCYKILVFYSWYQDRTAGTSWRWQVDSESAEMTSSGKLFHSLKPVKFDLRQRKQLFSLCEN